jgi:hypothetical protein
LHREEVIEPFDQPIKGWLRHRTTYYTPKGEEWRIPAMQLLSRASGRSGGWNEYYERLEGMCLAMLTRKMTGGSTSASGRRFWRRLVMLCSQLRRADVD